MGRGQGALAALLAALLVLGAAGATTSGTAIQQPQPQQPPLQQQPAIIFQQQTQATPGTARDNVAAAFALLAEQRQTAGGRQTSEALLIEESGSTHTGHDVTLQELSNLLANADIVAPVGSTDAASAGVSTAAFSAPVAHPAAAAPFSYTPAAITPETMAALLALAPAGGSNGAGTSAAANALRFFLQSVLISGDTLFKLRMSSDVEKLLHDAVKNSVSGSSAVAPERVEVIAASNVTLPLAFQGVDWTVPGAAAALRSALERLGGGFDHGHIQVTLVNAPLLSASSGDATAPGQQQSQQQSNLARRLLQQQQQLQQPAGAAGEREAMVSVVFADMSVSNATSLLDALSGACGNNGTLVAGRPLACAEDILTELDAAGAVRDRRAYAVRLRDKPASTITLTLGLGLTPDDVAAGAEARAAKWFAGGDLTRFLRTLNLTATPLSGLLHTLPGLGALQRAVQGSPQITLTIAAPASPSPAPSGGATAALASGHVTLPVGWLAGIAIAAGTGIAALCGVIYMILSRRRRAGVAVTGVKLDDDSMFGGALGDDGADGRGRRPRRSGNGRRGRRVYNQQKDLTNQLMQARALQARDRATVAEVARQRAEQEAAAIAAEEGFATARRAARQRHGVSSNGGDRTHEHVEEAAENAAEPSHHLERGDSVMSAARFELDAGSHSEGSSSDGDGASASGNGPSGISSSRGSGSGGSGATSGSRASGQSSARGGGLAESDRRSLSPSGRGCDDGAPLLTHRRGAGCTATTAAAAPGGSCSASGALTAVTSLAVSSGSSTATSSGASLPPLPRSAASLAANATAPSSPLAAAGAELAHARSPLCPAAGDGAAGDGAAAQRDEDGSGEQQEGCDEPLPARPITGRLPTPFAGTYASFSEGD